ncbi:helix-turn-helix domain-containing protein [Brevibacillus laterosporus]|uniref:Helix-turn-helix transcriptional regulator n=1 Tax=Brevibacillus laterosporus TaxID=1465 RepID=A0AAP3DDY1_BRELA|nr:helix-turn-helix transcriptional regulator [Brevibacillus laterosporus]MCR8978731.1 helix-turn-helix domain-containing protein [Brevibacillus laterosporus]MCZ0805887.1 helix-turn-helix transcriptional regulator [Brevibacillus laterosporus]MCZ0824347.1 helix-turn-helix transcriptional regulator [Brevibacillus laterosporus]MCZ0848251.1 helix-turn-helix transcriptional regulator [Brevibacillus laterosporus]
MFAQIIKELRTKNKYSHQQIADKIGITRQAYSNYEKGRVPDTPIVQKIADIYGVSIDYLLGRSVDLETEEIIRDLETLSEDKKRVILDMIKSYVQANK